MPNTFIEFHSSLTHRIHGAGIYANIKGVYWWDPCYHSSTMDPSWVIPLHPSNGELMLPGYPHDFVGMIPTDCRRETSGCWLNQQPDPTRFEAHIMLYHVISCYIMLYHVISCYIMSKVSLVKPPCSLIQSKGSLAKSSFSAIKEY